jgi:hypothetical protein
VTAQVSKDKKKETNNALSQLAPLIDEKSPRLLFVDSLAPIELVVSFYSMSRWYEQRVEAPEGKGGGGAAGGRGGGGGGGAGKKTVDSLSMAVESDAAAILTDGAAAAAAAGGTAGVIPPFREFAKLEPGSLMAECHSWKSLVSGQPLLRIHTTAIRSSFLRLAPGRHVLRLSTSAPVGHHMHIVSNSKFVLGDEDEIMPKLTDVRRHYLYLLLLLLLLLLLHLLPLLDPKRSQLIFFFFCCCFS